MQAHFTKEERGTEPLTLLTKVITASVLRDKVRRGECSQVLKLQFAHKCTNCSACTSPGPQGAQSSVTGASGEISISTVQVVRQIALSSADGISRVISGLKATKGVKRICLLCFQDRSSAAASKTSCVQGLRQEMMSLRLA